MNVDVFVGIPILSKGRTATGCDCYGLVRLIYQQEGIELPLLLDYDNTTDRAVMTGMVARQPLLIGFKKVETPQPLDVLVIRQGGWNCHLAVVLDERRMIHSEAGKGSAVELYSRPHIKPRIKEIWRYER